MAIEGHGFTAAVERFLDQAPFPVAGECDVARMGLLKPRGTYYYACILAEGHEGPHSFTQVPVAWPPPPDCECAPALVARYGHAEGCPAAGSVTVENGPGPYVADTWSVADPTVSPAQVEHLARLVEETVVEAQHVLNRALGAREFARHLVEMLPGAEDDEEAEAEEWEDEADREPRTGDVRMMGADGRPHWGPGDMEIAPDGKSATWPQANRLGLDRCPKVCNREFVPGGIPCTYAAGHEPPCSWDRRPRIPTAWPPPCAYQNGHEGPCSWDQGNPGRDEARTGSTATDALTFALRTVSDPDLTEAEIRERVARVTHRALRMLSGDDLAGL